MKYLASIFLLSSLAAWIVVDPARAQITISESESIATINNVASFNATSLSALAGLVGKSGASQTWDFTVATYTPAGTDSLVPFLSSGGLPYESDPEFAASTNVREVASTYGYDKYSSSGAWTLGLSGYSSGSPVKFLGYTPPLQNAIFPLTYQATWSGTSATDGSTVPAGFTGSTTQTGVVDGWGTLITPPAQSNPALRIKQQQIIALSVGGHVISDTQYLYEWITAGNSSASIVTMSSPATNYVQTISAAGYTVPSGGSGVNAELPLPRDGLDLYLSQNPASNSITNLSYTIQNGGPVRVELMDALGHSVRMLENEHTIAGRHIIPIDPTMLAAGTYFIRMEANDIIAIRELTISH